MHKSENVIPLSLERCGNFVADDKKGQVEFIYLPYYDKSNWKPNSDIYSTLNLFLDHANKNSLVVILSSSIFAADFCAQLSNAWHVKMWVAVKLFDVIQSEGELSQQHAALLILQRSSVPLVHTKTRIAYTYCPYCEKTTKDYGGKKHIYHEFGTLMSDVWRDITVDFNSIPNDVLVRLQDLFGVSKYSSLRFHDLRKNFPAVPVVTIQIPSLLDNNAEDIGESELLNGDCLEILKDIPTNSIDFCFADPPYNLDKKYENWNDSIDIKNYFCWCDLWLAELLRVLKPGRTLAVLNIPQWCIRHYHFLAQNALFQNWIAWEGLSLPVRMIMPAHYSFLCFSKGEPRPLPGITRDYHSRIEQDSLKTILDDFCIRPTCIQKRRNAGIQDQEPISDLWWGIHRLKHNSKRVDHPCQLPPSLMRRIISLFSNENEIVLDAFNGAGTTTLVAQELNRRFIGIELSEYYHSLALERHRELDQGIDPFRKFNHDDKPLAKNSRVARLTKQKYQVSKKTLQLEVRSIASKIGKLPTRDEVQRLSSFPIEYFDNYFINWAEVVAAARTTGMSECKKKADQFPLLDILEFQ